MCCLRHYAIAIFMKKEVNEMNDFFFIQVQRECGLVLIRLPNPALAYLPGNFLEM